MQARASLLHTKAHVIHVCANFVSGKRDLASVARKLAVAMHMTIAFVSFHKGDVQCPNNPAFACIVCVHTVSEHETWNHG